MIEVPLALTERAAFLLRLVLIKAEEMGESALVELQLSGREYGVLALLEAGPVSSQHQLGAVLGIDRTTTVAVLTELQTRGLIDRAPDPGNRRAHLVGLTEAGEQVRARAAAVLADCDEQLLEPLPVADRTQLRQLLKSLL